MERSVLRLMIQLNIPCFCVYFLGVDAISISIYHFYQFFDRSNQEICDFCSEAIFEKQQHCRPAVETFKLQRCTDLQIGWVRIGLGPVKELRQKVFLVICYRIILFENLLQIYHIVIIMFMVIYNFNFHQEAAQPVGHTGCY